MRDLTDDECRSIMNEGEVPEPIRSAAPRVAVVFTQSWCPDWLLMRGYLSRLSESDVDVLVVEYDRRPFFREMMAFKEGTFANFEIPYVRYYRGGEFVGESNLVFTKRRFLKRFA